LVNRKWHSSIPDVRTFKDTDCAIDHHLVVAKVREKLSVYKRAAQKFGARRVNIEKLNMLEATHVTVSISNLKQVCNFRQLRQQWGHN
jgi:hypothetical protein